MPFVRGLLAIAIALHHGTCCGDEALLRRCLKSYEQYQGLRIVGKATVFRDGKAVEEKPFTANFGFSSDGSPPPYEIGHRIENPGEPHIKDPEIFIAAIGEMGQLGLHFERNLISSGEAVGIRYNSLMMEHYLMQNKPMTQVGRALFWGIDGHDPRSGWGTIERRIKDISMKVLSDEECLGYPCKRVQLDLSGSVLDVTIATEPTVQVIQFTGVQGPTPEYGDKILRILQLRKVESLKVFDRWLLCDRIRLEQPPNGHILVEVNEVLPLSKDYKGIWDYNALTGIEFMGAAEQGTRKGSGRKVSKTTKKVSYIDFTNEEIELIRQYAIAKTGPSSQRFDWTRIALVGVNAIALTAIVVWVRKRWSTK